MPAAPRPFRGLRRFLKREDGTATVEAILWLPLIFWLILLILNVSFIFFERSQALRMIQDVNRAFSVGRYSDEDAATAAVLAAIQTISPNARAKTSYDTSTGLITTSVNMPAYDLMPAGALIGLSDTFTIGLRAQHYMES